MKKAIKKLMAALLVVAMVCSMAIPAWADEGGTTAAAGTGSITIDNVITGYTYNIYCILDLEYHAETKAYRYTPNKAWKTFITSRGDDLTLDDKTGAVTWKNPDSADGGPAIQAFADAAGAYAKKNSIAAVQSIKAAGKEGHHGNADNSTSITFNNLDLGWYLVVSDLNNGVICSIDTTDPTAEIKEKNSDSTLNKHILENQELKTANNAGISDTVNFQIDITVKDGHPKNYVVHDKMGDGLTFSGTVSVFLLRHSDPSASGFLTTGYTLVANPSDSCTFEVQFDEGTLKPNDAVSIRYTATVNSKAVIAGSGNTNEAYLTYNNKNSVTSTTTTYVWGMGVHKYTDLGTGKEDTPLKDAEFQLYKKDNGGNTKYATFTETETDKLYKLNGWTDKAAEATKVTTPATGNIQFEGLDAGTYYLEETKAPTGYNMLTAPITVVISSTLPANAGGTASYTVTADGKETTNYTVRVENKAGTVLPSTGGMGTTLFYVLGGGLMVAAVVLLVTKKRMENK